MTLAFDPFTDAELNSPNSATTNTLGSQLRTSPDDNAIPLGGTPSQARSSLERALVVAVLGSLGLSFVARQTGKTTLSGSQSDNSIGYWVLHSAALRNAVIAESAKTVGAALGGPLGSAAAYGVQQGLRALPGLLQGRAAERAQLADVSQLVGRAWAAAYSRKLGEGLGASSADGLLVSLSTLNRASTAEDTAWRIIHSAAGLSHGDALSVTQVALNRLNAMAASRRAMTPRDVAADIGKLLLSRRTKRIVEQESQVALNFGTQILLMNAVAKGYLPADAEKVWITAVDERVCPVCAPMDSVAVKIDEPFLVRGHRGVLHHDAKLWVPPAHVNCRCRIVPRSAIEHGITTRTARFSRDNPTEAAWPIPAKFDQSRARLRSRMGDIVHQSETPPWVDEDVSKGVWSEALHPRGRAGKFVVAGLAGAAVLEAANAAATHRQTRAGYAVSSRFNPRRRFRTIAGITDAPIGTKITKDSHPEGVYLASMASLAAYRSKTSIRPSTDQVGLRENIMDKGFTKPVQVRVYDDGAQLWDGNHRLNIAEELGIGAVPIQVAHMGGNRARSYSVFALLNDVSQRRYRHTIVARYQPS